MFNKAKKYFIALIVFITSLSAGLPAIGVAAATSAPAPKALDSGLSRVSESHDQYLVNKYFTTTQSGEDTDYEISNDNLAKLTEEESGNKYATKLVYLKRITGSTHVHFYGRKKNGNLKVDLSSGALNFIRRCGISSMIGTALIPIRIVSWPAYKLIKFALVDIICRYTKGFKYGRKFFFKHWKYSHWAYQK